MAIGKERYTRNVVYVGGGPSLDQGHGIMYLLGEDGMMYYYDYAAPDGNEIRDQFMKDVMINCQTFDGRMRISFVFATNIIHTLTQIVHPTFLGMDAELPPLPRDGDEEEDEAPEDFGDGDGFAGEDADGIPEEDEDDASPWGRGGSFGGAVVTQDDPSIALKGTESVPHEAVGSVESIADTPIPFELWLFSIKKMGQNFAAANEHFARLSEEEQAALTEEYNRTFGL